jgi:hypothetical protein
VIDAALAWVCFVGVKHQSVDLSRGAKPTGSCRDLRQKGQRWKNGETALRRLSADPARIDIRAHRDFPLLVITFSPCESATSSSVSASATNMPVMR